MINKIENLDELISERARLHIKMELAKIKMHQTFSAIKYEIQPARQAFGILTDLIATPHKGLLNFGVGLGVDIILRRGLLSRSGFLPKIIIPFLVRNAASNYIHKNKTSLTEKGLVWLKKITDKPKPTIKKITVI